MTTVTDGDDDALTARTVGDINDIDAAAWDACAGPDNPFLAHAFLAALEDSGSAVAETGWGPQHVVLEAANGRVVGCAPTYVKGHSQGEYIFDYGWADAFERAGGRYYPKLLVAVPFTPATGPRLLVAPGEDADGRRRALAATLVEVAARIELSSLHVNFATEPEWRLMKEMGFLGRTGIQFHWENEGYADFDDFLAQLASRKRKQIRRERRGALENDIEIHMLTGADIRPEHWDVFFEFYTDTGARKWGTPYLTRRFFDMLGERMAEKVLLVMARRDGRWIAGAMNLIGSETLFGRYWGCVEDHRFLHFEACYYRAIDFAIERGMKRVEAGAQGPHKLQRGYSPVHTYSAHWIAHEGFRDAVEDYLRREGDSVDWEIEALDREYSPFRKTEND